MTTISTSNPQPAHSGDSGDVRTVVLHGIENLDSLSSVSATVVHEVTGDSATLSALLIDATERSIDVALSPWLESAAVGRWSVTLDVVFDDGVELTWPGTGQGKDILVIL